MENENIIEAVYDAATLTFGFLGYSVKRVGLRSKRTNTDFFSGKNAYMYSIVLYVSAEKKGYN